MASYTIASETISAENLITYYERAKNAYSLPSWESLDYIFQVALSHTYFKKMMDLTSSSKKKKRK